MVTLPQATSHAAASIPSERIDSHIYLVRGQKEIIRISQFETSSRLKFAKSAYAFTEQGVAMLSGLLNGPRAIAVNVEIMRAFVRLRQLIASSADLARKLASLERKYDAQFKVVFDAIRELMTPVKDSAPVHKREIGFHTLLKPAQSKKI
jgi:hypothetical protein